jgi:hypothetical protein
LTDISRCFFLNSPSIYREIRECVKLTTTISLVLNSISFFRSPIYARCANLAT